jgi:hypothetical protein
LIGSGKVLLFCVMLLPRLLLSADSQIFRMGGFEPGAFWHTRFGDYLIVSRIFSAIGLASVMGEQLIKGLELRAVVDDLAVVIFRGRSQIFPLSSLRCRSLRRA